MALFRREGKPKAPAAPLLPGRPRALWFADRLVLASAAFCAVISGLSLFAAALAAVPATSPGAPPVVMAPFTAVVFLVFSASMVMSRPNAALRFVPKPLVPRLALWLPAAVAIGGLLLYIAPALGASVGSASGSGFTFALLGGALVLRTNKRPLLRAASFAIVLFFLALLFVILLWLGYVSSENTPLPGLSGIAILSIVAFVALLFGMLLLEVPSGYMHVLAEDSPAGDITRRMLPAALVLPPIIGYLRLLGEYAHWYDTNVGVTLHASALVGVFSVVAAHAARSTRKLEVGRREAEDARRKSEAWFATAFRASPVGMTLTEVKTGTFIDLNPAAEALLGVSKAEATGKTSLELGVVTQEARAENVAKVDREGRALGVEIPLTPKGGLPRTALASIETLDYGGRLVLLTVMVDITERKRAEEAVFKSREELAVKADELARSNSELEQFAYVASHDLQEPLRMVASYVQLLKRRYQAKLDADADEFIGYAVEGANRMQALINDLLTYSRVGTRGKPMVAVDASLPLKRAIENLQVASDESKTVIKVAALPTVKGDEMQLAQLFQNLLSNAIKYHGPAAPEIHVSAARDGEAWHFEVRDNGIGIDPKHFDRIFIIFQRLQARDETSGTGIGLALCKKIVERHGGRIWVESALGEGSTFHFTIPDAIRGGGTTL